MPFFRPVKSKKRSKRYDKVSHKVKIHLFKRVLCDKKEIKETADQLKMNYSTAKTLMRKYYRFGNQINLQVLQGISRWYQQYDEIGKRRCGYRILDEKNLKVKVEGASQEGDNDGAGEGNRYSISLEGKNPKIQLLQQVLFNN